MGIWRLLQSDRVIVLCNDGPARWIRADQRFDVGSRQNISTATVFSLPIQIQPAGPGPSLVLEVMAFRRVVVELDGGQLFDSGAPNSGWKILHRLPIPEGIAPGPHVLRCRVTNDGGPSLLRLKCTEAGFDSNSNWSASTDGVTFKPAVPADQIWEPTIASHYLPDRREMILLLPLLAVFFAVGMVLAARRSKSPSVVWSGRFRWILLGALLLLAWNNIFKVPRFSGYDLDGHYQYIDFVASHLSLPRPDLGWQTFQSPLYYILSAALSRLLTKLGATAASMPFLLRTIPLACGAAMVEIGYRAGRLVFPDRGDLQMITTAFAGLVPVNIYMAQTVSNEPLAAVLSGVLLLIILRMMVDNQQAQSLVSEHGSGGVSERNSGTPKPRHSHTSKAWPALAGAALGAAFLAKINTVLWVIPLMAAMAIALRRTRANWTAWIAAAGIVAGTGMLCGGWLIVRNIRLIGKPFYLQSTVAGSSWWQDPGYRVPSNFFEFGHVFSRPAHNGNASVWDSIYGTLFGAGLPSGPIPWNLGLMWHGLWLGLIPSILIFGGMIRAVFGNGTEPARTCLRVAMFTVGCFVAAILYVYLTLPVFSCGKASYMLGTMPCLGLLAANGFDWLPTKGRWRPLACGGLFCWGMTAYLTYFVVGA
jgi:hypothetical protein